MEEINQLDQQEAEQIFKLPNSWRDNGIKDLPKKLLKQLLLSSC